MPALYHSDIPGFPRRRGKVRDIYDLGDRLVLVTTDRLSAFDWVLPTPIPGKGSSTPIVWGDQVFVLTAIDTGRPAADTVFAFHA